MTIPETLSTADVLRLLPALAKWDRYAAVRIASKIDGAVVSTYFPNCGWTEDGPHHFVNPTKVKIPSEVVTRELGLMQVMTDRPGPDPMFNVIEQHPRPAIIISTEGAE